MRDHDLFRKIVAHAKEILAKNNYVDERHVSIFDALLIINHFHHIGEEETLFPS